MSREKDLVAYKKGSHTLVTQLTDDLKCVYTGKSYEDKRDLVMTYEEASKIIDKVDREKYVKPWKQVTKERFWNMLEVLPPCGWNTTEGVEMFFVSEAHTGNLHSHFASISNKYYEAIRDRTIARKNLVMELEMQLERNQNERNN